MEDCESFGSILEESIDIGHISRIAGAGLDDNTFIDEIEFRIGKYKDNTFVPGVSVDVFAQILKFYNSHHYMMTSNILTVKSGNVRARIIDDNNANQIKAYCANNVFPLGTTYEKKKNIGKHEFHNIDTRLSISSESKVLSSEFDTNRDKKHFRYARRYSFILHKGKDYVLRLDLSSVKQSQPNARNDSRTLSGSKVLESREIYEVELELSNFQISEWNQTLKETIVSHMKNIIKIVQGGVEPSSADLQQKVADEYRLLFDTETPNLFAAPNINVLTHDTFNIMQSDKYVFTDKIHGKRMLLFISQTGCVFFINCISCDMDGIKSQIIQYTYTGISGKKEYANTVFDGEYINFNGKHRYYIFDILFKQGTDLRGLVFYKSVQDKLVAAQREGEAASRYYELGGTHPNGDAQSKPFFDEIFRGSDIEITAKSFYQYTPANFRKMSAKMAVITQKKGYVTSLKDKKTDVPLDGFIFQPENIIYPTITNSRDDRLWKQVCKWKPLSMITVDFKLQKSQRATAPGDSIGIPDTAIQEYEAKYGKHPGIRSSYPCYVKLVSGVPRTWQSNEIIKNGDIVECEFKEFTIPSTNTLDSNSVVKYWYPLVVRYDKSYPNSTHVYNSNMDLLSPKGRVLYNHLSGEYSTIPVVPAVSVDPVKTEITKPAFNIKSKIPPVIVPPIETAPKKAKLTIKPAKK